MIKKSLKLHIDPAAESFDVIEFKDGRIFERYTRPQHSDGVSAGHGMNGDELGNRSLILFDRGDEVTDEVMR